MRLFCVRVFLMNIYEMPFEEDNFIYQRSRMENNYERLINLKYNMIVLKISFMNLYVIFKVAVTDFYF